MPHDDPTRDFHDELLSAYLDGELSADECARVEERLAVDPVARQLLAELRLVSQSLQGLPHEQLGQDLSAAILERAKQIQPTPLSVIAPQAPSASTALAGGSPAPTITVGRSRRGWIWAGLAVAAALLLMFRERNQDAHQGLPNLAQRAPAPASPGKSDLARDESQIPRLDAVDAFKWNSEPVAGTTDDVKQLSDSLPAADKSTPMTDRLALESASGSRAKDVTNENARGLGDAKLGVDQMQPANKTETNVERLAAQAPTPAVVDAKDRYAVSENPAMPGTITTHSFGANIPTDAGGIADGRAMNSGAPGASDSPTSLTTSAITASPPSAAPAPVASGQAVVLNANTALNPGGVLVVYVDLKPAALRDHAMDAKLKTSGFTIDPAAAETVEGLNRTAAKELPQLNSSDAFYSALFRDADPARMDAVLVDGSPAQVSNLLAALDADADNVVRISIDDEQFGDNATKAAQLTGVDWTKLNRATVPEGLRRLNRQLGEGQLSEGEVRRAEADTSSLAMDTARRGGGRGGVAMGGGGGGGRGRGGRGGRAAGGRGGGAAPTGQATEAQSGLGGRVATGENAPANNSSEQFNYQGTLQAGERAGGDQPDAKAKGAEGVATVPPAAAAAAGGINSTAGQQQSSAGARSNFGAGGGFGGGGFRGGGGGAQGLAQSELSTNVQLGRARRLVVAQPATPAGQQEQSEKELESPALRFRTSESAAQSSRGSIAPMDTFKADDKSTAADESEKLAEKLDVAKASANRDDYAREEGSKRESSAATSASAVAPPAVNEPRGGALSSQISGATAAGPQRSTSNDTLRAGQELATRLPANTLQVLFVLRAAPEATSAPSADAAGKPATSPAAADPAK